MESYSENSETSGSPISKGLALGGSILALVVVSKDTAVKGDEPPMNVSPEINEINIAQADHTKGDLLKATSSSSTGNPTSLNIGFDSYKHHSPSAHCANVTSHMGAKEKIQYGIFKFFIKKHLTDAQAAGPDGNIGQESGWNPEDSGGYFAQWGGERLGALERYARRLGKPVTSPLVQLKYIWLELTNGPGAGEDDSMVLKHLKGTKTAAEAATVFSNEYERPGIPALENRIFYAEQIERKFGHMACINANHTGVKARIAVPQHSSTS